MNVWRIANKLNLLIITYPAPLQVLFAVHGLNKEPGTHNEGT